VPRYLTFTTFTADSLSALTERPSNHAAAVSRVFEKHGGKLIDFYWTFGEADVVFVYEAPSNEIALAGLFTMLRDRLPDSGTAAAEECDPYGAEPCVEEPVGGLMPAGPVPVPVPVRRPVLSAETACRNTAYLCADLADNDRIQLHRWTNFTGTLVVHVPEPQGVDAGTAQRLQWAATAGIRLWNGQPFPIAVDERGTRAAQVEVRWVDNLGGSRIGLARTKWSPQTGLLAVSLELAVMSPFGRGTVDPRQLRLTAAHEMGHILGLPHSDQARDVMYPTNTATSLSARDHRALEALYELEDGTEIVR